MSTSTTNSSTTTTTTTTMTTTTTTTTTANEEQRRERRRLEVEQCGVVDHLPYPDIDSLYPSDYAPPNLVEAMREAEIPNPEALGRLFYGKARNARNVTDREGKNVYSRFSVVEEDVATFFMYTYEITGDMAAMSPYRVINQALESRDPEALHKTRHLIWKLLFGLRKLPRVYTKPLLRGIKTLIQCKEGEQLCWHRFSSTSLNFGVAWEFVAGKGSIFSMGDGKVTGDNNEGRVWAYDLRDFSFFSQEEELLLEPEQIFRVKNCTQISPDCCQIQLEFVDHPFLLRDRICVGTLDAEKSEQTLRKMNLNLPSPVPRVEESSVRYNYFMAIWDDIISKKMAKELQSKAVYQVVLRGSSTRDKGKLIYTGKDNFTPVLNLFPDTVYQVRCRIITGEGINQEVSQDSTHNFRTAALPPLVMECLSVTCFSCDLRWNDVISKEFRSEQEQLYQLWMSTNNGPFEPVEPADSKPSYLVDKLVPNTHYCFKVQLILINPDRSRYSSPESAVLPVDTPPNPPLIVQTTSTL